MEQSGSDLTEIRSLAANSNELLDELRIRSSQTNEQRKGELEQFGSEAVDLIDRVASQIASELAETLEAERELFQQECNEWNAVRVEIETELASREQNLEQQVVQSADAAALQSHCESLEEEISRLQTTARSHAEAETRSVKLQAKLQEEQNGLQQKFDLALGDLQQHRDHVAQLEEALAARPEKDDSESIELAQLRNERDELVAKLDELSAQASQETESVEVADLRARFEMAVDEVRQLKTNKVDLEQRLQDGSASSENNIADGDDWESQKRRMLAMLDAEGDAVPEERNEERASISGTIQITDGVIQAKEERIAELEQQLVEQEPQEEFGANSAVDEATVALLNDDELITAERERLALMQHELQEKLRAAELELSVERAKLTRAQSEISKQQEEIGSVRNSSEGKKPAGSSEGRRNWFKKMGLSDDIKE